MSTNTKHTPGPWAITRYSTSDGQLRIVTDDNQALPLASVNYGDGITMKTTAANARLIAAAPDLLEALKKVLAFAEAPVSMSADHDGILAEVRAAIAKATGKTA